MRKLLKAAKGNLGGKKSETFETKSASKVKGLKSSKCSKRLK